LLHENSTFLDLFFEVEMRWTLPFYRHNRLKFNIELREYKSLSLRKIAKTISDKKEINPTNPVICRVFYLLSLSTKRQEKDKN
jgi:hypothetical protein